MFKMTCGLLAAVLMLAGCESDATNPPRCSPVAQAVPASRIIGPSTNSSTTVATAATIDRRPTVREHGFDNRQGQIWSNPRIDLATRGCRACAYGKQYSASEHWRLDHAGRWLRRTGSAVHSRRENRRYPNL